MILTLDGLIAALVAFRDAQPESGKMLVEMDRCGTVGAVSMSEQMDGTPFVLIEYACAG